MLTKEHISAFNSEISILIQSERIDDALCMVHEHWLVFPHLPETLRDDERFALAAMSANLRTGSYASLRLKTEIDLLVSAFNQSSRPNKVSLTSERDTAFLLEYAKYFLGYRHEITPEIIAMRFGKSLTACNLEISAGVGLARLCHTHDEWMTTSNKEVNQKYLREKSSGFSEFSYHYAYEWASTWRNARISAEYR